MLLIKMSLVVENVRTKQKYELTAQTAIMPNDPRKRSDVAKTLLDEIVSTPFDPRFLMVERGAINLEGQG